MLFGTGSTNQYHTIESFVPTERIMLYKVQYLSKIIWLCMIFLLWSCSPLPRRGLLVRVRMLVKGRVCRKSPFYIKFLTLHPSLIAIVMHLPYFMILSDTSPKMLENILYQKQSACALSLQSFFFFAFPLGWAFAGKKGFWFLKGCICLISCHPTLTSRDDICLSTEWLEHGSECSYHQK